MVGSAAGVMLVRTGWAGGAAGFALAAVTGLLWLNGAPALLSLGLAAGGVADYSRRNRAAKIASPGAIRSGRAAPGPAVSRGARSGADRVRRRRGGRDGARWATARTSGGTAG